MLFKKIPLSLPHFSVSFYILCTGFFILSLVFLSHTPQACSTETSPVSSSEENKSSIEIMTIDGVDYEIPPPWQGNKLKDPKLSFSDFSQIPVKYTRNNTKIYILKEAQPHLVEMLSKAEEDGIIILVESAYRSTSYQKKIFRRMLSEGRTFEDIIRYVAPPGYSEHMLGTAVDLYPSNWRFADTPQHIWLQENAHKFNFSNTYSEFNSLKMPWEAWHWNYQTVSR